MRARLGLLAAIVACAALLAVPAGAGAATSTPRLTQVVKMGGKTKSGKRFRGTYTIDHFARARRGRYAGRLVSVGTVRGKLGGRKVRKRRVVAPARLSKAASSAQLLPPLPNSCQILNLVIGPITLNLLGLVVRTNTINVRIDAQRGPGNLLGNLLCAITGILDPQNATARQLGAALNAILALVPRTATSG
jgi:hypothetical protein